MSYSLVAVDSGDRPVDVVLAGGGEYVADSGFAAEDSRGKAFGDDDRARGLQGVHAAFSHVEAEHLGDFGRHVPVFEIVALPYPAAFDLPEVCVGRRLGDAGSLDLRRGFGEHAGERAGYNRLGVAARHRVDSHDAVGVVVAAVEIQVVPHLHHYHHERGERHGEPQQVEDEGRLEMADHVPEIPEHGATVRLPRR